jgi:hypothetical protein
MSSTFVSTLSYRIGSLIFMVQDGKGWSLVFSHGCQAPLELLGSLGVASCKKETTKHIVLYYRLKSV